MVKIFYRIYSSKLWKILINKKNLPIIWLKKTKFVSCSRTLHWSFSQQRFAKKMIYRFLKARSLFFHHFLVRRPKGRSSNFYHHSLLYRLFVLKVYVLLVMIWLLEKFVTNKFHPLILYVISWIYFCQFLIFLNNW